MDRDEAARALLGASWAEVEKGLRELLGRAESKVVTWRWAPDHACWERHHVLGSEGVFGRASPPRDRAWPEPGSEQRADFKQVGFDAGGEVVVVRMFTDYGGGRDWPAERGVPRATAAWVEGVGGVPVRVLAAHGQGPWAGSVRLLSLTIVRTDEAGEVAEITSWQDEGDVRHEVVEREAGRVVRVRGRRVQTDVSYGRDGELALITWTTDDDQGVTYRRRTPASVRSARLLLEERLVEGIAAWATRQAPGHEAVILAWSVGAASALLALGLATAQELRDDVLPADLACFDPRPPELFDDVDLQAADQVLLQHWTETGQDDEPERTLRSVAEALGARGLSARVIEQG